MAYDYRSKSNGDVSIYKRVIIVQVSIQGDVLSCEVVETSNAGRFTVYMESAVGLFYSLPALGEEWWVSKLGGSWVLRRRTSTQNPAFAAMKAANPGDVILNATGAIKVISPMEIGYASSTFTNGAGETAADGALVNMTLAEVSSTNGPLATPAITPNRLEITKAGTYHISMIMAINAVTTGRSFAEIYYNSQIYRSNFTFDDRTSMSQILTVPSGADLEFRVFQTSGGSRTATCSTTITRLG